jgi:hypothetical protein
MSEVETAAAPVESAPAPIADNAINSDTPAVGSPAEHSSIAREVNPHDIVRDHDLTEAENLARHEREVAERAADEPQPSRPPDMPRSWANDEAADWSARTARQHCCA